MAVAPATTRRPFSRLRLVEGRVLLGEAWLGADERVELALPDCRTLPCRIGLVGHQLVARAELLGDDPGMGRPEVQFVVSMGAFARKARR